MSPSASTSNARETFLAAVRAANLFAPMYLAKVEAAVPATVATQADAARALVAAGHLTKFQAERLLAGKTDGFHLGPYVILEQVGRGPMGRVYKARHQTMNRPVAVKVLSAELTRKPEARQALQKEVRAAAQLNHPNIVTAYDANELGDRFYLVLELVDGPNLETLVKERGPLPIAEACELIRQTALGLEHAHSQGMVHRDLKPTNLLVSRPSKTTPDHLLKIADFGIAKFSPTSASLEQTPAPGGWLGTADYVAPEQTNHPQHADHRVDIYSLGAVLYFLLTGRPPFAGGTVEDKTRRHLWEEPARLELVRPDVPPVLAILAHQMLAKHPAHRPSSGGEVAARLAALLAVVGDAINFDLPAPHTGPYSFVGGQLSGSHPVPPPDSGAYPSSGRYSVPRSGAYAVPSSGAYAVPGSGAVPVQQAPQPAPPQPAPVAPPPGDPNTWAQIATNEETVVDEEEDSPSPRIRPTRRPQSGSWVTTLIVLVMAAACFGGIALALKFMIK